MAKRGKLNNVEKHAIAGAYGQKMAVSDIADLLDRTEKAVQNYIDGEMDDVASHIASAQLEAAENAEVAQTPKTNYKPIKDGKRDRITDKDLYVESDEIDVDSVVSADIIRKTFKGLREAGLTANDANQLIESAIVSAAKSGKAYDNNNKFYTACISRMSAGHFINKQTQGGAGGVAVMSGAASAKSDHSRKKTNQGSRHTRGNIFSSEGQLKEDKRWIEEILLK